MSDIISDGGPAFPQPNHIVEHEAQGRVEARNWMQDSGMSLRDWYAGLAMQGLLASLNNSEPLAWLNKRREQEGHPADRVEWTLSKVSYEYADAMIAERNKSK